MNKPYDLDKILENFKIPIFDLIILIVLLIALLLLLITHKNDDRLNFIVSEMVIENEHVRRVESNRGILTLKNFAGDYHVRSLCPMVNSSSHFYIYNKKADISNVEAPYVIFKSKNENFFYIVKDADTLKFQIVLF